MQPFAMADLPVQSLPMLGALMAGCLLLLMPTGMPGRGLGLLLCTPVLFVNAERPSEGEIWFTLLDVGQGLACLVETSNHILLYDTGPGGSVTDSVTIPLLRSRGYQRIDALVVSNGDQDHIGGFDSLNKSFPSERILAGEAEALGVERAQSCQVGQSWKWDGVHFQVLHPPAEARLKGSNNRSCVLKIANDEWSILLPGDIEWAAEEALLQTNPQQLQSDILVAPHHGSNSSSTAEFVTAVDPKWVLFSTGYKNSYGFPKTEVIQRWQTQGAKLLNTAEVGAIEFRLLPGEKQSIPRLYREVNRQYWSLGGIDQSRSLDHRAGRQ
jgi:competence protein ComEC